MLYRLAWLWTWKGLHPVVGARRLRNGLEFEDGGEVVEILVDNGTPVEFGQVLMRVKPA